MNIIPITKVSFKIILKERIFIGSIIVYFLLICLSYFLSELVAGDTVKVFLDFLFSFTMFMIAIFCVFISISNIFTELKERIVYIIFSKPFSRTDYILGKFIGTCLAFILFWLIISLMCYVSIVIVGKLANFMSHILFIQMLF